MKSQRWIKNLFAAGTAALLLTGCQSNSMDSAETEALRQQIARLEQQVSALEQQAASRQDAVPQETPAAESSVQEQTDAPEDSDTQAQTDITADSAQLVGGSPLTTAANVIAEKGLLERTVMVGGMSLPLALSAVLMKDGMELSDLPGMLIPEAREELKEFQITSEDSEDDI